MRNADEDPGVNLTPMIDVTLLLILFFLLASQAASADLPPLDLPEPLGAREVGLPPEAATDRVVVNVLARGDEAGVVRIGGRDYAPAELEAIRRAIAHRREAFDGPAEDFFLELRAERRIPYEQVAPLMRAAAEAGVRRMNITVLVEARGPAAAEGAEPEHAGGRP
jgi:biopolymer transport protein ExbD